MIIWLQSFQVEYLAQLLEVAHELKYSVICVLHKEEQETQPLDTCMLQTHQLERKSKPDIKQYTLH